MFFKLQILYYFLQVRTGRWAYGHGLTLVRWLRERQLLRSLKRSPFYSGLLHLQTGIPSLPLMNKRSFMQHFNQINTLGLALDECMEVALQAERSRDFSPMIRGISVGLSTGTSGNRGLFLVSSRERAIWVACILDRVIGLSWRKRRVAFFLRANNNLYGSVGSSLLQFSFFDIFQPLEEHFARLEQLDPHILVAQPSVLCLLAKAVETGALPISPHRVISVAEVLSPEDSLYLESVFGSRVHQVYQCTEGFLAATCREGTMHFNEDLILVERKYVDQEKTRFHPVITDLLRRSQPVIRYELDDIVIAKEDCRCGSRMLAIDMIEGRSDDILRFIDRQGKEVRIFPDLIRRTIVIADTSVQDYCMVQREDAWVELYIGSPDASSFQRVGDAIRKTLAAYGIEGVTIQRMEMDPFILGSKKRRVIHAAR